MSCIEAGKDESYFRPSGAHWPNVERSGAPNMKKLPSFLKISSRLAVPEICARGANINPYQPLLGLWLIDMALIGNWINEPPSGSLITTFCDNDYLRITGLKGIQKIFPEYLIGDELLRLEEEIAALEGEDNDFDVPKANIKTKRGKRVRIKQALKKSLLRRRVELLKKSVDGDLPLFQNVRRAGRLLHLNDTEQAVLTFAACMSCFSVFRNALIQNAIRVNDSQFTQLLTALTGQSLDDIRKAIHRNSVLMTAGLVKMEHDEADLEDKIQINRTLRDVILDQLTSDEELSSRVLRQASPGKLSLNAFPHLSRDIDLMRGYLSSVMREGLTGSNILLYGPPGCGKTEFAKALMAQLGITLYEIAYADDDGDPIDGEQRLQNFNFCQQALKGKANVALLFDEMEDVFAGGDEPLGLFGSAKRRGSSKGGKAWINRTLEQNPIPTIWITNDAEIDEAYLRRFDYSLALRVPPRQVRATITAFYLAEYAPSFEKLSALADLDDLLPAQLERASRVARLSSHEHPDQAWECVEQYLLRSRELLGQPRVSLQPSIQTGYSLDFIRADANINDIVDGLKRTPRATFCLYGPPGTGKSLLARQVADELGVPLLLKRASDLLDKYLGETEQRITAMFAQAQDEGAILLLDEADSFLCDRMGAQRQWELTQTNEFLTRLESFEGIFFATTNLVDKLDAAVLRRFSHKIKFDFLSADQRWNLFRQEAERLGIAFDDCAHLQPAVRQLDLLAPGDFATSIKKIKLSTHQPTAESFFKALEAEFKMKRHGKETMGFI